MGEQSHPISTAQREPALSSFDSVSSRSQARRRNPFSHPSEWPRAALIELENNFGF